MNSSLWYVSKRRTWDCNIALWESDPWDHKKKGLAITQLKDEQSDPLSSKRKGDYHKEPRVACVHLAIDIVQRHWPSLLPQLHHRQLPLSCILTRVLEASPTPLIPWDLSSPLHDKCIWTQSVCNVFFLLQLKCGLGARPDQRCPHFCLQVADIYTVGVCVWEKEKTCVWKMSRRIAS